MRNKYLEHKETRNDKVFTTKKGIIIMHNNHIVNGKPSLVVWPNLSELSGSGESK